MGKKQKVDEDLEWLKGALKLTWKMITFKLRFWTFIIRVLTLSLLHHACIIDMDLDEILGILATRDGFQDEYNVIMAQAKKYMEEADGEPGG